MAGFDMFLSTVVELMENKHLEDALVGIEPIGYHWFNSWSILRWKENLVRYG
jgi:hypothetical protein